MKILLSDSGAGWSTHDVYRGVHSALERAGQTVFKYSLTGHIEKSRQYMDWLWENSKRTTPRATNAEWLFHAGVGSIERALFNDVDWVIFTSGMYVSAEVLIMLKRAHVKTAILFTESPNDDDDQIRWARLVDLCWVNDKSSVESFKKAGIENVYYYQHAYDPELHFPGGAVNPGVASHDVVFVGTGWIERVNLFEATDWTGIDFGLYGTWELMMPNSPCKKYLRPNIVKNEVTADLYRNSKIGINLHRTSKGFGDDAEHISQAYSINPRCYELAACGTFFISDYRPEIQDVFGDLVPTFKTPEELRETIFYYLEHEDERLEIAKELPKKVSGHTFDSRVRGMLEVLK
jgi:spore maturation protein CgeB